MELTLQLPTAPEEPPTAGSPHPIRIEDVEKRLSKARSALGQQAAAGDGTAALALELFPASPEGTASLARRVAEQIGQRGLVPDPAPVSPALDGITLRLYQAASEAVEGGAFQEAAVGLSALLSEPSCRARALLGLSVCAARLGRYDEALRLALDSQGDEDGLHPRAYYVAGLAECLRGNRREAQTYLVRASRLARRNPGFGEDLRMAQRLLLLMQIGLSDRTRL